ncbi:hypothetical protein BGX38DRAFT_1283431, partial [Terfezia claveryi]
SPRWTTINLEPEHPSRTIFPTFNFTPLINYTHSEPTQSLVTRNEMSSFKFPKPECFSGEGDSASIEDFLDSLKLSFIGLESQNMELNLKEKAKILTLQKYLDGEVKQFWGTLKADKKATFEIAANVLEQRFNHPVDDFDEWAQRSQAIGDLNNLS